MNLMESDMYWAYCVLMLREISPFTRWYNRRILEIQASGIPAYWQTDVVIHYMDMFTQSAIETDKSASNDPVRLTVSTIAKGIFYSGDWTRAAWSGIFDRASTCS